MDNTLLKSCRLIAAVMAVALLSTGCAVGKDDPIPQDTETGDPADGGADSGAQADASAIEEEIVEPLAEQTV